MSGESVKVIVRCRPENQRETSMGCKIVVGMDPGRACCEIRNPADPAAPPKSFTFDGVYFIDAVAEQIYNEIVYPLVENVLEGYNGTVFAYGQTGSGKTFTMQGPDNIPAQRGVIPRTFEHIFEATATAEHAKFLVHASYLEIYKEEVRDLLGKDSKMRLDIKEHPEKGVYVTGLSMHAVHGVGECEELMGAGTRNRHVGSTLMNKDSSRSHSIFSIYVEMMQQRDGEEHIRSGKLHLVDLAGSERQSKTGSTGTTFKEATKINLSLSALGNVISALVDGKSKHIPYRDSKLTRLLQDSLGGNTKTIMVACMSPADNNYDESLSTLRYANRAKNIKNKPKINEDPKDALLREYQLEIQRLKDLLTNGGEMPTQQVQATTNGSADTDQEKALLREEFEKQVVELKQQYQAEQKSNALLQEEMRKLQGNYDEAVARVGSTNAGPSAMDGHGPLAGLVAPTSSPTSGVLSALNPQEALQSQNVARQRLEKLQQQVVGGEQANNAALKEKRMRKKQQAEKRLQTLTEALSNVESDDPMLRVYNTVQDKLAAVTRQLEKERKKVKSLENEIQDLQSEFELDRIDYLDTIRRQDQQWKLLQQILDKVHPCLRRDSNYANIEKIKKEAQWDEDLQKWHLPDVSVIKTQLPPPGAGGIMPGGRLPNNVALSPRQMNGYSGLFDDEDNKLKSRLHMSSQENLVNNYFKPMRSSDIITRNERDKYKSLDNKASHFPNSRNTWDNLMNGVIYTNDLYERGSASSSPNDSLIKKPQRLEALEKASSKYPRKKRTDLSL